ncbi:MAG: carboxymuconolactone decarboxylase family protein [Capsulimonas sp.]|uniref:carboxymuconolactone decarboxylase family protein n=1 Tax=Capsulimonas sp. TaxID=2494211 RepID=UPI0032648FAB
MTAVSSIFPPLDTETAPGGSRPLLEKVQKSYKFIPNMFGAFANSPVLLEGYVGLESVFDKGSLTASERHLVMLTASMENECSYCVAAHSTVLKSFLHAPAEVVSAVRSSLPLPDPKSNALVALTREMVSQRGHVAPQTIENFLAVGYRKDQILEVLIGVALKTISNYTDHISPIELDNEFRSER